MSGPYMPYTYDPDGKSGYSGTYTGYSGISHYSGYSGYPSYQKKRSTNIDDIMFQVEQSTPKNRSFIQRILNIFK